MNLLPSIAASVTSYFLGQLLFPSSRFRIRPLVSPLNWFLCLYFLQMVLVPVVVAIVGPSCAYLPFKPSNTAIDIALLLNTAGYLSFCGAFHVFHKKEFARVMKGSVRGSWFPPVWMILLYAALGIAGVVLRFGNLGNLIDYFTNPQAYLLGAQADGGGSKSLSEAAPTFLLMFLPFSMVLLWCRGEAREPGRKKLLPLVLQPILIALLALSSTLYGYSRAGFVIPMVAVAAVVTKRGVLSDLLRLSALGILGALLLFVASSYRMLLTPQGQAVATDFTLNYASDMIQDYGSAPQYLGFLLERTGYAESPRLGRVLLGSALSPLPIVGKAFREQSGNAVYQNLLGRSDQPITFVGELFLDFSIFGVIAGFVAVGACAGVLQNRFESSPEPFEVYVLQFASIFLSYLVIWGLGEVSLQVIDLSWPVYFFLLYRAIERGRRASNDGKGVKRLMPLKVCKPEMLAESAYLQS